MHILSIFYDGDCPLCRREIEWLERRNHRGQVHFIDIADPDFKASDYGKTHAQLMKEIHGQRPDGSWLRGVELFAELYELTGLPLLARLFKARALRPLLNWSYRLFARNRLRITGRDTCAGSCLRTP